MKNRLVVLISNAGTGTNLQAIIDSIKEGALNAKIVAVLSDRENAYGLKRAEKAEILTSIVVKSEDLLGLLRKYSPDFICLAGWKQIIQNDVIEAYQNKILNIHPGLIPDTKEGVVVCPDGSLGLWNAHKMTGKAIQNFFENHATYGGSSLHFMTLAFDFGPVLGRCFEKIEPEDTSETFYERLKKKENALYVSSLITLCNEK